MNQPPISDPMAPPFDGPQQERIYERLGRLVGPGPAAFYRDACRLMSREAGFATTTHLVSHLLREIESALTSVLLPLDSSAVTTSDEASEEEGHRRKVEAVLGGLGIPLSDPVARLWLRLIGKGKGPGLATRAHRSGLGLPRPRDDDFRTFWTETNDLFDVVLDRFEATYSAIFPVIDELTGNAQPTKQDTKTLAQAVPNTLVARGRFFAGLSDPVWLGPLRARGFFRHPPDPERVGEGGIRFPEWPETGYLAQVAHLRPKEVRDIIRDVEATENARVLEDLVDALLRMPPDVAASLADRARVWATVPIPNLLPEKLGALIAHLAVGGDAEEALDLARVLLAVRAQVSRLSDAFGEDAAEFDDRPSVDIRSRFDTWEYRRILTLHFPTVVEAVGEPALRLLCELLDEALRLGRHHRDADHRDDLSPIWRTAIVEDDDGDLHGVEHALTSAIRDAALNLVTNRRAAVEDLVLMLEARQWTLFKRLALLLLSRFPAAAPGLSPDRLRSELLFRVSRPLPEHALALRAGFRHLGEADQEAILTRIAEGPDRDEIGARILARAGREATPEELERAAERWQLERLALVSADLSEPWRPCYEELLVAHGEPDDLAYSQSVVQVWQGPTSPAERDELVGMGVVDIVTLLRTWEPSGGPFDHSIEGLGWELRNAVGNDPERFAAAATEFRHLDPAYVRAVLSGLQDAVGAGRAFPWPPVIALCHWVAEQPTETLGRQSDSRLLDPDWGWARRAVADLIVAGLRSEAVRVPFELRWDVWATVETLAEDPEPTPEYEARYGGANMKPTELATRTTRGRAIDAAIRYAVWARTNVDAAAEGGDRPAAGLADIAEAAALLERHLDPSVDPALSVRAVYGLRLPLLIWLDADWVRRNLASIFPEGEALCPLRDAAWEAYVVENRAHRISFDLLRGEYLRAIEEFDKVDAAETPTGSGLGDRLAHHLMELYWNDNLSLDEPNGLLARFYSSAPARLRREALRFLGRSLEAATKPIPAGLGARMRALLERRLAAARDDAQGEGSRVELPAFGTWFASGALEVSWSLARLTEILQFSRRIDLDSKVVKGLAGVSAEFPGVAIDCLTLLVEGDTEGWHIDVWRCEARVILSSALACGDGQARVAATRLINRLIARNNHRFEDLLRDDGGRTPVAG